MTATKGIGFGFKGTRRRAEERRATTDKLTKKDQLGKVNLRHADTNETAFIFES